MRKVVKYISRGVAIFIGLIILLYTIAYIYVATNRQQIIQRVTKEINEKLNGTIAIGNVDISFFSSFPQVGVLFNDVSIRDSLYQQHKHTFFYAKEFFANISIVNVVLQRDPLNGLRINNASMYVYTDTSGYTTSYLFTPRKRIVDSTGKEPKKDNELKQIRLKDFRFILDNKLKDKLYDFEVLSAKCAINANDSMVLMRINKETIIHDLAFNLDKGSFAKETSFKSKFDLAYNKDKHELLFNDIDVELKGHPFKFSGAFKFDGERPYKLSISTRQVTDDFVKTLVTKKIATAISKVEVEKPVDAEAEISGILAPGEPLVKVKWKVENNNIKSIFFDVNNATCTGGYTNEMVKGKPRNDVNSIIYIDNLKGSWEGLPVTSKKARISNLIEPVIDADLQSNFQLAALNNVLESNSFKLNQGNGSLNLSFHGPLQENSNRNTFINGTISFKNGSVLYTPRNITMENLVGDIVFKSTDVYFNKFSCRVKDNRIDMNGSAKNLLSLIKNNPGKIGLDWHVYSPALNLESFLPLLQKRNRVVATTASKGKLRKVARQVDQMLDEANVKLQVNSGKVYFKKFEASDVNASIDLVAEDWHLNDVSLKHANGSMRLNGHLKEASSSQYIAAVNINMQNVDINKVLYSFNNFQQDAIVSDNIRGKLSTNIVVSMNLDRQMAQSPTNLEGFIDFSLKNGALVNFEPMRKLQIFLFKNRNFDDIRFAELKNRIEVKDREFIIKRMEIQSSALTLFVNGVYSLKGNTDLSIQVPLSNLKKRDENFIPTNVGADAKAGPSVFVRGKPGEDGNIKFRLDVLNKIRKRFKKDIR